MGDVLPRRTAEGIACAILVCAALGVGSLLSSYLTGQGNVGRTSPKRPADFKAECPHASESAVETFIEAWTAQNSGDSSTACELYARLSVQYPSCSAISFNLKLLR
jgi:hypothetical protein